MNARTIRFVATSSVAAALMLFAGCDGSSGKTGALDPNQVKPQLVKIEYGRLVDIYSYRRLNPANGDRRDRFARKPELVAANVVIHPSLTGQDLFDAAGEEIPDANFEFRPFDSSTGHPELLILWDDRDGPEAERFKTAMALATAGLPELAPAFRSQNTSTRPIPVMPRDAALQLSFSGNLNVDASFFDVNPSAIQLLEFKGDPDLVSPAEAFRSVSFRVLPQGDKIVVDPTILGGEGVAGQQSSGLPRSVDSVTANIRLAIPSRGGASSLFYVREDGVTELNGVDSFGRSSVVRDFRSGNLTDVAGTLPDNEAPMIIAAVDVGIRSVNAENGRILVNKRLHQIPVRGRFPFAEGMLTEAGLPLGPAAVPTVRALRAGDMLTQVVNVTMPNGEVEAVTVKAEILQNFSIGTTRNDPAFPGAGRAADGSQGENVPEIEVRVASVFGGKDSLGRPVAFTGDGSPFGTDAIVRAYYYEDVRFLDGSGSVSDSLRRFEYLRIDPRPPVGTPAEGIDPNASFSLEFTKPMDFERLDYTTNFVLSNQLMSGAQFFDQITNQPKVATAGIVATRLTDQSGDGTVLQLQAPAGLFHSTTPAPAAENYWFHALLAGNDAITDFAGNRVAVYDDTRNPTLNWSFSFTLNPNAPENAVGWIVRRFASVDEDGTLPGSVDIFGQFRLLNGSLLAAETVRFSRTADNQNLGGISRINRGECWDPTTNTTIQPDPGNAPVDSAGAPHPGFLYWQPRMFDVINPPFVPAVFLPPNTPQNVGRVVEPHQPRGCRMMMRYIEDDFSLDYRRAADFALDVEQLYWSPFNDENVLFDTFDRYTMSLAHSDKRPEVTFILIPSQPGPPVVPAACRFVCAAMSSGLETNFADNILRGSEAVTVFEDKVYQINPNEAFRSPSNVKYVPFPRFDRSYTWRDSRLVTVDAAGQVVGLGGARNPRSPEPNDDWTTNIDSPWITSVPAQNFTGQSWVMDPADFIRNNQRDHDPIALPLLVDFKVFPDSASNGFARGSNSFQMAMLGQPSNGFPPAIGYPGGYYNQVGSSCPQRAPWTFTRVHSTGGLDPNTGQTILVDPANTLVATGGNVKDAGLGDPAQGLFAAPPGDGMINWAQADFVRKVSTMTFGFIDTVRPNFRQVAVSGSVTNDQGIPDFAPLGNMRIRDLVSQMDPPINRQPAGTSVVLEFRAARSFTNSDRLYNPSFATGTTPSDLFDTRGNLLNPNYACEAYRYSRANAGQNGDTPRIVADGLTAYVTEDRLAELRDPANNLLPRFLNIRIGMTNNVDVTPAISPSLRSFSLIFRMERLPQ